MRPRGSPGAIQKLRIISYPLRPHTKTYLALIRSQSTLQRPQGVSSNKTREVAVIGGGITGLATAYHLAKDPYTRVTLWERSQRLGGWLESKKIDTGNGHILFEYGPRTFRATVGSLSSYALIDELGLSKEVLKTGVHEAAARNRYIYYPDHLVRLPAYQTGAGFTHNVISNAISCFSEPVLRCLPGAILHQLIRRTHDRRLRDDSVGNTVSRFAGKGLADNLVSSVLHGIYAGDLYKLSARAIFPSLWQLDSLDYRGLVRQTVARRNRKTRNVRYVTREEYRLMREQKGKEYIKQFGEKMKDLSTIALRGGMGQLAEALSTSLNRSSNVTIMTGSSVDEITRVGPRWTIGNKPTKYNSIISTTSPCELYRQLGGGLKDNYDFSALKAHDYAVNVMVVNLFFNTPNLIPVRGFGYLIPRVIPLDQNPERALGVMFMSEFNIGQDTAQGTKLTVMMGGHWWDGWRDEDFPDEAQGIEMAKSVVRRHLQIDEQPVLADARLLRNAIPQYTVGHISRMQDIHASLSQNAPGIRVAGAWYSGVGANDCTRTARLTANSVLRGRDTDTGLEEYLDEYVDGVEIPRAGSK